MMNQNPQWSEGRGDHDTALSHFLASLMDYTPTIPDELVEHYLAKSGFQCPDVRLWVLPLISMTRLVAVATQKFVAEVAGDALFSTTKQDKQQFQKTKGTSSKSFDNGRPIESIAEYGLNLRHQEYFADSPSTGMDPATREE